jgi:DNA adenine methylase
MAQTSAPPAAVALRKATPFLRWAGSKRKLLPKLMPYWGSGYRRYIEPFAGSGALFFALRPGKALLSDINGELIEAMELVRDSPAEIHGLLSRMRHTKDEYYRIRSQDRKSLGARGRVTRFIYLNRYCFNGLYRTNLAGQFNVPFAASGTGDIPSLETFLENAKRLGAARLVQGDFDTVVRAEVKKGDFVYLDPPFAVENRRIFRQYGPQTFGIDDLARLSALLREIEARGAHFLLSYACCKEVREYFGDWK